MASNSHLTPNPAAPPEQYRQQVAASIQDLVSGRRAREPVMSGAGTARLILEGVVENVRIYRLHKEEQARGKEDERKRRGSRYQGKDRSRKGRHGHRPPRQEGDGERLGHRVRYGAPDERDGNRRGHRRRHSGYGEGHERRRRHGSRSREKHGDREVGDGPVRGDHDQQQRSRSEAVSEPQSSSGDHRMSGALPVGAKIARKSLEKLLGPDGTPFGTLPARGKGIGLLAHARTMYQHIKAEHDVGHRSKGFLEKHIDAALQKREGAKSVANDTMEGEELLIETNSSSRPDRSGHPGGRRRRRRSRSRGTNREVGQGGEPVFMPVVERGEPSAARQCRPAPSESGRSFQQPALSAQQPPSRPNSFYGDRSVRVGSLAPSASVKASQMPTPSIRGAPSVREVDICNAGGHRSGSRVPTIRVQSPTPPKQASSVRLPTPTVRGMQSRVQSPEPSPRGSATPVWNPGPYQHTTPPPEMPTPLPATVTPYHIASSAVDMPAPIIPIAPPPSPPAVRLAVDSNRDAFLASIQVGVKLKKASGKDNKGASVARKDEAHIEDVTGRIPVYEETPHSHDVEALEHAQAVEEREIMQEEERIARSKTPCIAPQPRPKLPTNFQDDLTAKLGKMKLNNGKDDGEVGA
ncbi:uncharacterized protein M421DRAFT_95223 [Didymella exigua CBS 183.55]|uniref:WH2 domain-containing protein n=1 Tax=Didymella exigua CBS 183.55 TaxID=1150837 RepID=A0A6A5RGC3_9PLEO|nr:uncharacterized protein M421DRAFT_95223 [Didymella exigua CBS 183.55]KAF1924677.1 hypothetical protein M421DRAFT_95223 [Didymella exigua CBS 183.55]